jgi:opacity protein-like surface antigen
MRRILADLPRWLAGAGLALFVALAATGVAAAALGDDAETGESAAGGPGSAPDLGAGSAEGAPASSDRAKRARRVVRIDDLEADPSVFVGRVAPIDTSIVLNLDRVEREPERRWSLHMSVGTTQADLQPSVERGLLMERFGRDAFGDLPAGALPTPWSNEGPTDPKNAGRVEGDIRFRLTPLTTLEAQVGYASAQTRFAQPGFRFDETARILDFSGGALFTLPWRLWRFGFYAGGGGGFLLGKLTSQFFVPSFNGTPTYVVSEADGNSTEMHVRGGGEIYLARFVSLTLEGEYRWAKIEELTYAEGSQLKARNETDVPTVWTEYTFSLEQQIFFWDGDPSRPITFDFTGASVTAGLRYHF